MVWGPSNRGAEEGSRPCLKTRRAARGIEVQEVAWDKWTEAQGGARCQKLKIFPLRGILGLLCVFLRSVADTKPRFLKNPADSIQRLCFIKRGVCRMKHKNSDGIYKSMRCATFSSFGCKGRMVLWCLSGRFLVLFVVGHTHRSIQNT